jgi:hypothetical protein
MLVFINFSPKFISNNVVLYKMFTKIHHIIFIYFLKFSYFEFVPGSFIKIGKTEPIFVKTGRLGGGFAIPGLN